MKKSVKAKRAEKQLGKCINLNLLMLILMTFGTTACNAQPEHTTLQVASTSNASATNGESSMTDLTEAIKERDAEAGELAVRMGSAALPELSALMQSDDSTDRMMTIYALGEMDLSLSYELVFKALDDEDYNVMHAAVAVIEKQQSNVSTEILLGLLDKISEANAKNRIILLLGNRLTLSQTAPLEKYCTTEYPQSIALHCMAALAKVGVEQRRKQFSAYLLSIKDDNVAYMNMFSLIEYIAQPWIVPSLRLLLSNKQEVQSLGDVPGFPATLRVCDKAVQLIGKLLEISFSFNSQLAANFNDEQLAEVNLIASNYQY